MAAPMVVSLFALMRSFDGDKRPCCVVERLGKAGVVGTDVKSATWLSHQHLAWRVSVLQCFPGHLRGLRC